MNRLLVKSRLIYLVLIFLSLFLYSLGASEKVISKIGNVDLLEVEKFNIDGVHFGSDLFVSNHNDYPIQVSIKITDMKNIKVGLMDIPFLVDPFGRGYFGWLIQEKKGEDSKWNVEWYVIKLEKNTKAAVKPASPAIPAAPKEPSIPSLHTTPSTQINPMNATPTSTQTPAK